MITIFSDGFEIGFYDQDGIPELTIPNGWKLAWVEGEYSRPEADEKKAPQPERHSGDSALSIQTTNGHKHKAVLHKRFAVEPGKLYRASVWVMGLTHTAGDSGAGMRIGIDQEGLVRWRVEESVKWGQWYDQYHKDEDDPLPWKDGEWVNLSVTAEARDEWITVFLWTSCDWNRGAMAHFDDFSLTVEGDEDGDQPQPSDDSAIVEQLRRIADALESRQATGLFARLFRR